MKRCLFALVLLLLLTAGFSRADGVAPEAEQGTTAIVVSAADAAVILRAREKAGENGSDVAYAPFDLTQNGVLDDVDVRVALFAASGKIPDLVKFVERVSTGLLGEAEFERFRYGDVYDDHEGNYKSDAVSVTVTREEAYNSVYYVADIYLQDLRCLATAVPPIGSNASARHVDGMAQANGAIIAVNGDYYTYDKLGPTIRNGETVISGLTQERDICILTYDGELIVYPAGTLTRDALSGLHVYQSWIFGPSLLDEEGRALFGFSSGISGKNPRSVIGYYAPGHYCFLLVDGRQGEYSVGLSLNRLAEICGNMGLAAAYNLDGGQSAEMATRWGLVSRPYGGGRQVSDIVYIREAPEAAAR